LFFFFITALTFIGYFFFTIFCGIGLAALPFDLINAFRFRPRRIDLETFTRLKAEVNERAVELLDIGTAMKERGRSSSRSGRRKDAQNYNKFKQAVYLLETDYERLITSYKPQRYEARIIFSYIKLFLGFIAIFMSLDWLLHKILYIVIHKPPNTFLNQLLIIMDGAAGLLGTAFYGLFTFYLLLSVVSGNFKFGMRIFIFFPIHPMKVNGTLMNSFLFNTLLILLTSVTVTQFCTIAFNRYTTATAVNEIFSMSIDNLFVLKYFWQVYTYILLGLIPLSAILLFVCPAEKPHVQSVH